MIINFLLLIEQSPVLCHECYACRILIQSKERPTLASECSWRALCGSTTSLTSVTFRRVTMRVAGLDASALSCGRSVSSSNSLQVVLQHHAVTVLLEGHPSCRYLSSMLEKYQVISFAEWSFGVADMQQRICNASKAATQGSAQFRM